MNPKPNDELERLSKDLALIKAEFLNLIVQYETIINFSLRGIEDKYMSLIGGHMLELLNIDIYARKLKRKIELLQAGVGRAEKPDPAKIDAKIEYEMIERYEKLNDLISIINRATLNLARNDSIEPPKEALRVFTSLVKRFHPVLNPSTGSPELMKKLASAFKNMDLKELKELESLSENERFTERAPQDKDSIIKQRESFENGILEIREKIDAIKSAYPYKRIELINNPELLREELNAIEEKKRLVRQKIVKYEVEIKKLIQDYGAGLSMN